MKKLLLSFTILFITGICISEVQAQIVPEFGIRGGVNFASFSDSKQEVDSRRTGLLVGVYLKVPIPVIPVSIQSEVLYSQKGAEINGVEVRLSYIEIPLLVKVDLAREILISPHLYAGPYLGFNLNHEEEPAGDQEFQDDGVNNDFGLIFGAGIDISRINVGVRYSLGLEEVFEDEEIRNNAISIVAGIKF